MDLREMRAEEAGVQEASAEALEEPLELRHYRSMGGSPDVDTNHEWEKVGPPQPDRMNYPYCSQQWHCGRCGIFTMLPECHPPNKITLLQEHYDCDQTLVALLLEEID